MQKKFLIVIVLTCLLNIAGTMAAQEWTRFRGPNGTGESEAVLPAKFEGKDFVWKAELPGEGHSSPVIWKDRVFLLSADPKTAERYVLCLDAKTGTILWNKKYPSSTHTLHPRSSYASCTPTVDERNVYFAWSAPDEVTLMALTHDGDEVWRRNLGRYLSQHGWGTSPILYEDLLILNNSQDDASQHPGETPGESYLMAFDKNTGKDAWQIPRASNAVSYSVPCIYKNLKGEDELICLSTGEGVYSVNPLTGKTNWEVADAFDKRTVSSPVIAGGLIFGTTGSGGGGNYVVAVHPPPSPFQAYTIKKQAPYVPTPVARGKALFLWSDAGSITCIDAATGKVHWEGRGHDGGFSGSPIRAGDKIYCVSDDGVVVSIAADPKALKVLGKTELGEMSRSTPAVSGGRLFVRTVSHLFCLGNNAS